MALSRPRKLCNKPFPRQVSPYVTLQHNDSITFSEKVTPGQMHSPEGLDPKGGKGLQLEISTDNITAPYGLRKDEKKKRQKKMR